MAPCRAPAHAGFSVIEAIIVMLIVMVIVGTLTPTVQKQLTHTRISRAARAASADFYLAQALAQRERQPVTVTVDPTAKTMTLKISTPDTVLQRRYYGLEGEYKLPSISASPASAVVYPSGMASTSMTVSMSDGTFTRQVRMSRAGQILVLH